MGKKLCYFVKLLKQHYFGCLFHTESFFTTHYTSKIKDNSKPKCIPLKNKMENEMYNVVTYINRPHKIDLTHFNQ